MKKTLTTLTAAATIAAALTVASTDANAQRRWGPAVGLGILGGVAAGAIVGSAIANSYGPAYVVQPGYAAYDGYYAAAPVACPGGYWARRQFVDQWGNVRYSRPRFFCP
jgi:hypothetical protein